MELGRSWEVVDLDEYSELLKGDEQAAEWDSEVTTNEFILDDWLHWTNEIP